MKRSLSILAVLLLLLTGCDSSQPPVELAQPTVVDAGCGQCMFALKHDKKCNLAIRREGKSYFVDGFTIRQFGNPDVAGGMCKKVHQARVTGKIANSRFAAGTFELLPSGGN